VHPAPCFFGKINQLKQHWFKKQTSAFDEKNK